MHIYVKFSITSRTHKHLNRTKNVATIIHMKVEANNVYPCLVSGLDNYIKLDLIRITQFKVVDCASQGVLLTMVRFVIILIIFTSALSSTVRKEK